MPLPRPIARGAGYSYPGPSGSGRASGLGRYAALWLRASPLHKSALSQRDIATALFALFRGKRLPPRQDP